MLHQIHSYNSCQKFTAATIKLAAILTFSTSKHKVIWQRLYRMCFRSPHPGGLALESSSEDITAVNTRENCGNEENFREITAVITGMETALTGIPL